MSNTVIRRAAVGQFPVYRQSDEPAFRTLWSAPVRTRRLGTTLDKGQPILYCVIINNHRLTDTRACLESLQTSTYQNWQAIVLDVQPLDDSVDAIRSGFPEVEVLALTENRGYAGNNNVGIQAAVAQGADWVLILNEDTVLDRDCLTELVLTGGSDPRIGIVGPMVYHFGEPGVIQSAGGILGPHWQSIHLGQNQDNASQFGGPHSVEWVSGCAIMIKRSVIEQVGMLDERFFCYWEEVDWCLRASAAGWRVVHVPQAELWHKGVQRDYRPAPLVTYYSSRNRLLMLAKHRAPLRIFFWVVSENLRTLASWTLRPRWRHMRGHRNALLQATVDFVLQRWGRCVRYAEQ